ncbi:MAG: Ig-like domain-containing protein [Deltaproteobacteria bacterium]|nr:Ig-like domain-containing protein [Deltaproteobacteria bacterium]
MISRRSVGGLCLLSMACGTEPPPPGDTTPPTVESTRPAQGDMEVAREAGIEIRFSEPMNQGRGQVLLSPLGVLIAAGDGTWDAEGRTLSYQPEDLMPYNTPVTVVLEQFRDLADNAMDTYLFGFLTVPLVDESPPRVSGARPFEGERDVPISLTAIVFSFDEAMDPLRGSVQLSGGAGRVGVLEWTSARELRVPIEGLEPDRAYRLALMGFRDLVENPLDGRAYLGDGALDFTTARAVAGGTTCATAAALTSSGTFSLVAGSTERNAGPSCFLPAGAVDWFRYRVAGGALQVYGAPAGAIGAIAVIDAGSGVELGCAADAAHTGLGRIFAPGTELCIAVASSTQARTLTIRDAADRYEGVGDNVSVLPVTPPAGGWSDAEWLAAGEDALFLGLGRGPVIELAKTASTSSAISHVVAAADNGVAGVALPGGAVFSADDGGLGGVVRLHDGAGAWSAEPWDRGASYAGRIRAIAFDGTRLIYAASTATITDLFALSPDAPADPMPLGRISDLGDVVGLAADAQYFYLLGSRAGAVAEAQLARVGREDLLRGTPRPASIVAGLAAQDRGAAIAIDDLAFPRYLYFRTANPSAVRVIDAPSSRAPIDRGVLIARGRSADRGMTYDPIEGALFVFETETSTAGRVVRLE